MDALGRLKIATPCKQSWESMKGDDRVRFCGACQLNVFNVAGMERGEALALIQNKEGRVCMRLMRRADGTVLTRDCPVGLAAVRRHVGMALTGAIALLVMGAELIARRPLVPEVAAPPPSPQTRFEQTRVRVEAVEPIRAVVRKIDPPRPPPVPKMGRVKVQPPPEPVPTLGEAMIEMGDVMAD